MMTASSGRPTPNMSVVLRPAGGGQPELHAGEAAVAAGQRLGDRLQDDGGGRGRMGLDDRGAGVAALAQGGVERYLTEHGHVVAEPLAEGRGDPVATAR